MALKVAGIIEAVARPDLRQELPGDVPVGEAAEAIHDRWRPFNKGHHGNEHPAVGSHEPAHV